MEIYLQDGEIAAEPYRNSIQAMEHPAVLANKTVAAIDDPRVGLLRTLAPLVELTDTPGTPSGPAPDVGQHDSEVLGHLRSAAARGHPREAAATDAPAHPLSGVTILDLATVQAGPYAACMLADLGARVIKIDATDKRLDEGRRSSAQALADVRTYSGKEVMQVDLQTPEGKEILHKLIAQADVLSHNYRLGVAERLQIDRETCRRLNPRLVYAWMGTYGENGRHARRPGAHPIPGAVMGGAMRQMGRGMPPPAEAVMDIEEIAEATRWIMKSNWGPDQNTSAAVATGIVLGLRARDMSGKGQRVSVSMLNANAWTNADEYYDYSNRPPIAVPDADIQGLHALYRLYRCRQGWVFLGCLFQDEWETFCRTVERPDLLADRRFSTGEARADNDEALIAEIAYLCRPRRGRVGRSTVENPRRLCPGRRSHGGRVLFGPSSRQGQCSVRGSGSSCRRQAPALWRVGRILLDARTL